MLPDVQGRLWSEQLDSWLVADGAYLRLIDINGVRRPTSKEAAQAEHMIRREAETKQKAEQCAREKAETENAALRAKLRELGIDPDNLSQ